MTVRVSRVRTAAGLLATVALTSTLAACGGSQPAGHSSKSSLPSPSPSSSTASRKVTLTFGVYGAPRVVKAYSAVAKAYRRIDPTVTVKIRSWPNQSAMTDSLAHGKAAPDVFLTPRPDVTALTDLDVIQPVDTFLEARNIDLGDGYSRTAIADFSQDHHLTCMPYAVSPEVLYVNTDLIDFAAMAKAGLDVPAHPENGRWDLDQFQAALTYASKPRRGIAGVYVQPTLRGLAPWITAAGGHVVDDATTPTTTTFGDSLDALKSLQPVLATPSERLSASQLAKATPLQWFERGKLAVLPGERSLVPQLRERAGLHWNVMAMPTNGGAATTGDYSGLCLSKHAKDADAAADFLAYLISSNAVTDVAKTGYVVPVNQQVAFADGFRQPGRAPANASVFTDAVRGMETLPPARLLGEIQSAVAAPLRRLVAPGVDLQTVAQRIDEVSNRLLSPSTAPSPSESASGSPTP